MVQIIPPNVIERFLNTSLIQNKVIHADYWSFLHIFFGMGLGILIKSWWKVLLILMSYEVFEVLFWGVFFRQETLQNIILDIAMGMAGFIIIRIIMKKLGRD